MAQTVINEATVSVGDATKKTHFDQLLANTKVAMFIEMQNNTGATSVKGEPVYVDAADSVDQAQADAEGTSRVVGLWLDAVADQDTGTVQTRGIMTGLSKTAGHTHYLSPDTAGATITDAMSSRTLTAGEYRVKLYDCLSDSEIEIKIGSPELVEAKAVWLQPHHVNGTGTTLATRVGDFPVALFANSNQNQEVFFGFAVPADYKAISKGELVVFTDGATGNLKWTTDTDVGADTQARTTHSESNATQTTSLVQDNLTELDHTGVLTLIEAADYVGLKLTRLGTDGYDTVTTVYIVGFLLEYTT